MKEGTLGDFGFWNEDRWMQSIPWRRRWFAWEKAMVSDLAKEIEGKNLYKVNDDEWYWRNNETQEYTIKSAYRKLMFENSAHEGFIYDILWKTKGV